MVESLLQINEFPTKSHPSNEHSSSSAFYSIFSTSWNFIAIISSCFSLLPISCERSTIIIKNTVFWYESLCLFHNLLESWVSSDHQLVTSVLFKINVQCKKFVLIVFMLLLSFLIWVLAVLMRKIRWPERRALDLFCSTFFTVNLFVF